MKNIFAFTEVINQSSPGFVSLNTEKQTYSLTVRGRGHEGVSRIELEKQELEKLHDAIAKELSIKETEGLPYGIIDPDYARAYTVIRKLAWEEGYAVTLHGSFTRDLDLVAIPWTDNFCEPEHLVKRICSSVLQLKDHTTNPGTKPHGRKCWTLMFPVMSDPRFIDLSIMTLPKIEDSNIAKE
jgi:hypothetical protein